MAISTREQTAVEAARKILSLGDWFEPLTIKAEIEALKKILVQSSRPDLAAQITVAGQIISIKQLLADLSQFNRALDNPLDDGLFTDLSSIKTEHLTLLENNLAAIIAPPPVEKSMDAVVPTKAKLQELQDILKAQATVTAEAKQKLGRPSQLQQQIKQAQEIGIRAQLLRVAVSKNLFVTLVESSYIRDLQAIYGKEAVNRLLAQRIDLAVNQSITALALNQLGVADPSHAAIYFSAQLEKNLKADRNLAVAWAKTPKSSRKNVLADAKNLAEEAATEVQSIARVFRTEQDSSPIYRVNAENIAQGEIEATLVKSDLNLTNKQVGRLTDTLTKYFDKPDKQLLVLKRILPKISLETGRGIISSLQPAITALAGSSDHPSIVETINQTSLINLARTKPALFPFRLTAAIHGKWLSTVEAAALTIRLSQQLGVSPDCVVMKLAGITSQGLKKHLDNLIKGQPVLGLPTQPPLKPDNLVFQRLNNALPEIGRLDNAQEELKFNPIASGLNLQNNWHSLAHFFDVGKAIRFNLGRLPSVNRMVSSVQTVFSGLRVQSGAVNSTFNFFSFVQRGIRAAPSVITAPFRAVGSAISAGWGKVKTWTGTQVKAGLAKAGAWLAKKGITAAATKLGLMAVGKGVAVLLAQAAPIVGQIAAVLTILSILGDIGKFIWDHKKEIGMGLGGMFFLGLMLLAKVIGFLVSAAWTLGGALTGGIIGFMVGGPIGAAVGTLIGGTIGYLISSGAIGSAIAGIGSFLSSAAAGISSFIGALSAPSLVAGLGSTIAAVGVSGLLISTIITIFFTQPRTNSAMFVPTESTVPGGDYGPPDDTGLENRSSCPLIDYWILHYSYNPQTQEGHGGNKYWKAVKGRDKTNWCSYPLPQENLSCVAPLDPGPAPDTNECSNKFPSSLCDVYGYALDVFPNSSWSVWLPQINGEDALWAYSHSFSNGNAGWSHIYTSSFHGETYSIVFTHMEDNPNKGGGLSSGTKIGRLYDQKSNTHLHMEMAIDGVWKKPELYFCDGSNQVPPSNGDITGWIASTTGANNLISTTKTEYTSNNGTGQEPCNWMGTHSSLNAAANANFWGYLGSSKSPRGNASYNNDPIPHSDDPRYQFWSLIISGNSPSLRQISSTVAPYPFAVSGTPILIKDGILQQIPDTSEGSQYFIWHTKDNRVAIGFTGNKFYLVVLQNATVPELQKIMFDLGVKNAINLDGGSKATFCQKDNGGVKRIFGQGASVPVSVGLINSEVKTYP